MQLSSPLTDHASAAGQPAWSAVGAMTMCVALLIAAEFMPVSLLTPIARDLGATQGMAGQAIAVSGLFAVATSLLIPAVARRHDRRHVLIALTWTMLASLVLIAMAPDFTVLMLARALLGVTIGGFWALSTATVMRLVPGELLPKALGLMYTGNAVAAALAAPMGSYFGAIIGWRATFWTLVPLVLINLLWQAASLPSLPPLPPDASKATTSVLGLLKRRHVALAMAGAMLSFGGAFTSFTYFRPFLETYTQASVPQMSMLLLGLGVAGFAGTYGATLLLGRHLYPLLRWLPLALGLVTVLLLGVGHHLWVTAIALAAWGALNAAIPVAWSTWLTRGVRDAPESGGGLMVAAIQLSIMAGAALGGLLLDHFYITATLLGGAALLAMACLLVGNGRRLQA
ncbi:MFS transporter [Janthinobacterium psychrotolerans]|uniref:Putative arabinose efflux permease, MFS family n=1 Tax=Janthinobacterium psychrotolerans TaxID=1747903 RepID=A0A1A7C2D4_9BURK|nr:MFS transporter [Janthinobacterium psychrotolerans]OBV38880.1 putative arabinose efflux permease, MFS family [Janthinobacterium psychrotolerans]